MVTSDGRSTDPLADSLKPVTEPIAGVVSRRTVLRGAAIVSAAAGLAVGPGACALMAEESPKPPKVTLDGPPLLCEPYLLDPASQGVRVAWFTESKGSRHVVVVGDAVATMTDQQLVAAATGKNDRSGDVRPKDRWRRYVAKSQRLSLAREDAESKLTGRTYTKVEAREVWRHLAEVTGISGGRRPYRVVSVDSAGKATVTKAYSLRPALSAREPARLLLTSDHQMKPNTTANIEVAAQVIGVQLDGVLMAGDCVNAPDRASEWFDTSQGNAFFANLTGRATNSVKGRTYHGAPVLQHTPIYPTLGNHEVMGRWSETATLKTQFDDPQPTEVATRKWEQTKPTGANRDAWIAQHSWNTTTYKEIFPFPNSGEGGPLWYSRSIGNVFLVSLFVASIWREGRPTTGKSKFQEAASSLADQAKWGYGEFIFEPIKRGSRQYKWLERTLRSKEARAAKYRVVMFHHSSHGLGWNSVPAFTDPIQKVTLDPATGQTASVTYSYPLAEDHIFRDVEPLLNANGVHLVFNGHSHLWNRFRNASGVHWLETSNVGDSFAAFDATSGASRPLAVSSPDLVPQGDPGKLKPVVPTIAPLTGGALGGPLPYVADSTLTVFSILDSGKGTVRSYRFDTNTPGVAPVLFDEFALV